MAVIKAYKAFWGRLEASIILMLHFNELSSVDTLMQSKYAPSVISSAEAVIKYEAKRNRLTEEERAILQELIQGLVAVHEAVKAGNKSFPLDNLKLDFVNRFLPYIRKVMPHREEMSRNAIHKSA